jgi:hypothetical protein
MLTASEPDLRDNVRALTHAQKAVALQPAPRFLDTLAEACYRNGLIFEAILTIPEAIEEATENRAYYETQLGKCQQAKE